MGSESFSICENKVHFSQPDITLPIGYLTISQQFFHHDIPSPYEVEMAIAMIEDHIQATPQLHHIADEFDCNDHYLQFIMRGAIDVVQIDACRLGGVNEVLAVLLMAAKYQLPVCPHAGGVGLCEYVQHLSMIDFVAIAGTHEGRVIEYVDHLHEHFLEPCEIRGAAYMPPKAPGFSIEMYPESREKYRHVVKEA